MYALTSVFPYFDLSVAIFGRSRGVTADEFFSRFQFAA